ncbi:hypothetical protein M885DRAFT_599765 [Pelagophyceae sp. CCMP2097]|nr:hypothetical protein M885DRAFT_599765 [Pelagophyceae sp. CCMP2097]
MATRDAARDVVFTESPGEAGAAEGTGEAGAEAGTGECSPRSKGVAGPPPPGARPHARWARSLRKKRAKLEMMERATPVTFWGASYILGGGNDRCSAYPIVSLFALLISVVAYFIQVNNYLLEGPDGAWRAAVNAGNQRRAPRWYAVVGVVIGSCAVAHLVYVLNDDVNEDSWWYRSFLLYGLAFWGMSILANVLYCSKSHVGLLLTRTEGLRGSEAHEVGLRLHPCFTIAKVGPDAEAALYELSWWRRNIKIPPLVLAFHEVKRKTLAEESPKKYTFRQRKKAKRFDKWADDTDNTLNAISNISTYIDNLEAILDDLCAALGENGGIITIRNVTFNVTNSSTRCTQAEANVALMRDSYDTIYDTTKKTRNFLYRMARLLRQTQNQLNGSIRVAAIARKAASGEVRAEGDKVPSIGKGPILIGSLVSTSVTGMILIALAGARVLTAIIFCFVQPDIRRWILSWHYYLYAYLVSQNPAYVITYVIIQPILFSKYAADGRRVKRPVVFAICYVAWAAYGVIVGALNTLMRLAYFLLWSFVAIFVLEDTILPPMLKSMDAVHNTFMSVLWAHHQHANAVVHAGVHAHQQPAAHRPAQKTLQRRLVHRRECYLTRAKSPARMPRPAKVAVA